MELIDQLKETQYKLIQKRDELNKLKQEHIQLFRVGAYLQSHTDMYPVLGTLVNKNEEESNSLVTKYQEVECDVDELTSKLLTLNMEASKEGIECVYVGNPGWVYVWEIKK